MSTQIHDLSFMFLQQVNRQDQNAILQKFVSKQQFLMHESSIQTQYYDQNDQNHTNTKDEHFATGGFTTNKYSSSISTSLTNRLQENIKEYQSQIKKNKQIINQLQTQRKFFDKLSLKQKQKIDQIDIQSMKKNYESKIFQIKSETSKLHEVIVCYQQDEQKTFESYQSTLSNLSKNKQFLMQTLIQLEKQTQSLVDVAFLMDQQLSSYETQIIQNENAIKEKQAVQRKYIELQIQIQRLEKIVGEPKR